MKKLNVTVALSLCFLIGAVVLFMFFGPAPTKGANVDAADSPQQRESFLVPPSGGSDAIAEGEYTEPEERKNGEELVGEESAGGENHEETHEQTHEEPHESAVSQISARDALFIGDSRTVGLSEYALVENADFFATVGMSVYNVSEETVSVPTVGKVTLTEILNYKKYGKIYVMLGINELGYNLEYTVDKYAGLLELIQESQPDAVIIIEANLHVTKSRSDNDEIINNSAVNTFNDAISKLADGNKIFYLDVNSLFDDENGNLSAGKSEDGAHLYAKYYIEWGEWIIEQTEALIAEG